MAGTAEKPSKAPWVVLSPKFKGRVRGSSTVKQSAPKSASENSSAASQDRWSAWAIKVGAPLLATPAPAASLPAPAPLPANAASEAFCSCTCCSTEAALSVLA